MSGNLDTNLDLLSGMSVVLVDDSRNFLKLVRSILRNFGIKDCFAFDDPTRVLNHLETHSPDCLITDLVMPKLNGFELTHRIRHSTEIVNRLVPIVMVTGYANRDNIQKAINSGIDEVLVKPFRPTDLRNRLQAIANKPRRFIKTDVGYTGPDRRRSGEKGFGGKERRTDDRAVTLDRRTGRRTDVRHDYFTAPSRPANAPKQASRPAAATPSEQPVRSTPFAVKSPAPKPAEPQTEIVEI